MNKFFTQKTKAQEIKENMQSSLKKPIAHAGDGIITAEQEAISQLCDLVDALIKEIYLQSTDFSCFKSRDCEDIKDNQAESDAEYEERIRKMDTKELLQDICVVGGRAYDIIKKILEERGAI